MLTNLVEKHGVVPKALFPEAEAGENSRRLERLTNNRVCSVTLKHQSQLQQTTNFAKSFLIFEKNKV